MLGKPNENLMEYIGNNKNPKKPHSNNFVQVDDGIGKKLLQKEEMNNNKLGLWCSNNQLGNMGLGPWNN